MPSPILKPKVWDNFKTLPDFIPGSRARKCWAACFDCFVAWNKSETEHVHMTSNPKPKGNESRTVYICDACLAERRRIARDLAELPL